MDDSPPKFILLLPLNYNDGTEVPKEIILDFEMDSSPSVAAAQMQVRLKEPIRWQTAPGKSTNSCNFGLAFLKNTYQS